MSIRIIVFAVFLVLLTASAFGQNANDVKLMIPSGHNKYIKMMAVSGDDRLLASLSDEGVKIWDLASGSELMTVPGNSANGNMPFKIGNTPHIGIINSGAVSLLDGRTMTVRQLADFTRMLNTRAVTTDPAGKFAYIGAHDHATASAVIIQINLSTGAHKKLLQVYQSSTGLTNIAPNYPFAFNQLSVSPDGSRLLAATTNDAIDKLGYNKVVINTFTGQIEKKISAPGSQTLVFLDNQHIAHFGTNFLNEPIQQSNEEPKVRLVSYPGLQVVKTINGLTFSGYYDGNYGNIRINPDRLSYHYVNLNPDEKYRRFVNIDFKNNTFKIDRTFAIPINNSVNLVHLQLLSDLQRIVVSYPELKIASYNFATKEVLQFGSGRAMNYKHVNANPKRNMIIASTGGSSKNEVLQVIDLKPDGIKVYNYNYQAWGGAKWSPDGQKAVFFASLANEYGLVDANQPQNKPRMVKCSEAGGGDYLTWAPDGKLFAHHGSNGIRFVDANTLKTIRRVDGDIRFANMGKFNAGAFSSDGERFVAYILRPSSSDNNKSEQNIICYQVKTGVKLWENVLTAPMDGLRFEPGDKAISCFYQGKLQVMDAGTGNFSSSAVLPVPSDSRFLGQNPNGQIMIFKSGTTFYYYNRGSQQLAHQLKTPNAVESPVFIENEEFVFFRDDVAGLRLVDLKRKAQVGNLVTFMDTEDYAILNNSNYFEGSQGAFEKMYFVRGSNIIPLQSLFEQFYTPRLFNMILGRNEPGPPVININTIKRPPVAGIQYKTGHRNLVVADDDEPSSVELSQPQVTITVTASAPDDKVAEIRLFHNGKLLSPNTRNLVVADDDREERVAYEVMLQPGTNNFSAISINSQRTESLPARLTLTYKVPQTAAAPEKKPVTTLHLLVVGINQYKNSRYNLNYAVADAKGFEQKIKASCGKIINECKTYFISDAEATKEKLVNLLKDIATKAQPQDMFVFYYAGHGVMSEGNKPDFFLVPHDVTQLYGNEDVLKSKGLSSAELQTLSVAIKAQKQLFVLDACQSAGALQTFAMRGAAEEKAIAQLARSTGTHWLTASGSDQFASEFDKLGHGAFTYVLMQGLSGEAALQNGAITVNSLKAYIETKVPEVTEQYKGTAQYPASYGFGQDFPLATR